MSNDIPAWYHGGITGEEATKILTKFGEPNAFLLRDSQNIKGAYTLTVSRYVETAKFVDVENYRIMKNRFTNWPHLKKSKKNFPSLQELEESIKARRAERLDDAPRLSIPIDKTMIDEWDRTEVNWRDRYKVEVRSHAEQGNVSQKGENSNKQSRTFSRFRFGKKKEHPSKETNVKSPNVLFQENSDHFEEVITEENQTQSSCTSSNGDSYEEASSSRDKEVVEGLEANVEVDDGIYTVNKGSYTKPINISHGDSYEEVVRKENATSSSSLRGKEVMEGHEVNIEVSGGIYTVNKVNTVPSNQIHSNEQAVRDDYSYDNEWNGDTSSKQTTVMDNEGNKSNDGAQLRSVSNDIYTTQHEVGINVRKTVVTKSGSVTNVNSYATIYCTSPVQTTTKDNEKHESEKTVEDKPGNKDESINYGIYTI